MSNDTTIAITPEAGDNTNLLRETSWQLEEFYIKSGANRSKSYRLPGAPKSANEGLGSDDFNFAPEYEVIEIYYKIDDPGAKIKKATLELFSRFEKKPLWSINLAKLGDDWLKHGEHIVKWDGRVFKETAVAGVINNKTIEHDLTTLSPNKKINSDTFPDGFITLASTPFKLRLTLEPYDSSDKGIVTTSWTFLHLLIEKMEIELGEEAMIPAKRVDNDEHKRNKAVWKAIDTTGKAPAVGAVRRMPLVSNLYKTRTNQMNTNKDFKEYKKLWGDGANIPLVAYVFLFDSAGNSVKLADQAKGSVALGNVKFLWDWEDPNENIVAQQNSAAPYNAFPLAFITAAVDYYKNGTDANRSKYDHTYPKGDNCHVDRGGKRGPKADKVFPSQRGYKPKNTLDVGAFPYKVEACKDRKWAGFSYGWREGKLKGTTGVVFQPSRMAGDDYQVSVYLAYDINAKKEVVLDDNAEPLVAPAQLKATTGMWQVWREIHLVRYIRKQATIVAYLPANLAAIQAIYDDAYVSVVDKMTANDSYTMSDHRKADGSVVDYNTLARDKLNASRNPMFTNDLAIDRAANHFAVDSALDVFSYADFVQNMHAHIHTGVAAAGGDFATVAGLYGVTVNVLANGLAAGPFGPPPHRIEIRRLIATQRWLNTNGLVTRQDYANWLDGQAFGVLSAMVKDGRRFAAIAGARVGQPAGAQEGITIVHFNFSNTFTRDSVAAGIAGIGYINGAAIDTRDANRNSCAFIFTNAMLDTFCHEIGHHMFLPHARFSTGARVPGGAQPNRHDDLDRNCMMSYNRPRLAFCGLCQLRLRGWDADKLDKVLANNKKP